VSSKTKEGGVSERNAAFFSKNFFISFINPAINNLQALFSLAVQSKS
jgi:hypothetical protein